jgi:hypothetical protein
MFGSNPKKLLNSESLTVSFKEVRSSKMLSGKKLEKPVKTKFKKNDDGNYNNKEKKKQHNKTAYRLMRQEKEEYEV